MPMGLNSMAGIVYIKFKVKYLREICAEIINNYVTHL